MEERKEIVDIREDSLTPQEQEIVDKIMAEGVEDTTPEDGKCLKIPTNQVGGVIVKKVTDPNGQRLNVFVTTCN